jgi:hypothetical protein
VNASIQLGHPRNRSAERTGHVERGIQYAFIVKPDRAWSTTELMAFTHALPL